MNKMSAFGWLKIGVLCLFSCSSLAAGSELPLFGVVVGVGDDDVLNIRTSPNASSPKVGALPGGVRVLVGVDGQASKGSSTWYRVYPLVQLWYDEFSKVENAGWVNGKFIKLKNRGYVKVDGKANGAYALQQKDGKAEVVIDVEMDNEGNVVKLHTQWIDRKRLRGASQFGVVPENAEGYCVVGARIEEFLKRPKESSQLPQEPLKVIEAELFVLSCPADLTAKKDSSGGVSVSRDVQLTHVSGSDMRDQPELLHRRILFDVQISVYDSLKSALTSLFSNAAPEDIVKVYRYDPKSSWFSNDVKADGEMVVTKMFCGKSAYQIGVGVEGSGVDYYLYRQQGKVVVVSQRYDRNPPLDPKTSQPIPGNWEYPKAKAAMQALVDHLKVK